MLVALDVTVRFFFFFMLYSISQSFLSLNVFYLESIKNISSIPWKQNFQTKVGICQCHLFLCKWKVILSRKQATNLLGKEGRCIFSTNKRCPFESQGKVGSFPFVFDFSFALFDMLNIVQHIKCLIKNTLH